MTAGDDHCVAGVGSTVSILGNCSVGPTDGSSSTVGRIVVSHQHWCVAIVEAGMVGCTVCQVVIDIEVAGWIVQLDVQAARIGGRTMMELELGLQVPEPVLQKKEVLFVVVGFG